MKQIPLTVENAPAASKALGKQYGEESADSPEALRNYLENDAYFFSSIKSKGSHDTGIYSGFAWDNLQIDYASTIEKDKVTERDIDVFKSLLSLQVEKSHPEFVMVEADAAMAARYEKLGFVKIANAAKDSTGNSQWDMYALPVTAKAEATLKDKNALSKMWVNHVRQWYDENYKDFEDPTNQAKKAGALAAIEAAAAKGQLVWIQEMPRD